MKRILIVYNILTLILIATPSYCITDYFPPIWFIIATSLISVITVRRGPDFLRQKHIATCKGYKVGTLLMALSAWSITTILYLKLMIDANFMNMGRTGIPPEVVGASAFYALFPFVIIALGSRIFPRVDSHNEIHAD